MIATNPVRIVDEIVVKAGETKDLGTIEVVTGRTVRGTVVDPAGAPVADAVVAVSAFFSPRQSGIGRDDDPMKDALMGLRSTRTAADGTFELIGSMPIPSDR